MEAASVASANECRTNGNRATKHVAKKTPPKRNGWFMIMEKKNTRWRDGSSSISLANKLGCNATRFWLENTAICLRCLVTLEYYEKCLFRLPTSLVSEYKIWVHGAVQWSKYNGTCGRIHEFSRFSRDWQEDGEEDGSTYHCDILVLIQTR